MSIRHVSHNIVMMCRWQAIVAGNLVLKTLTLPVTLISQSKMQAMQVSGWDESTAQPCMYAARELHTLQSVVNESRWTSQLKPCIFQTQEIQAYSGKMRDLHTKAATAVGSDMPCLPAQPEFG